MSKVQPESEAKVVDADGPPAQPGALTKGNLNLSTNKRYRQTVVAILMLFTFVDTLGTVLFMPAGPILCQLAEGGPYDSYAQLMYVPNTTE